MGGFPVPRLRLSGLRHRRVAVVGAGGFVLTVLLLTGVLPNIVVGSYDEQSGVGSAIGPGLLIIDNSSVTTHFGLGVFKMLDVAHAMAPGPASRAYSLVLSVARPLPLVPLVVSTNPVVQWSNPQQKPGGADNLPPLGLWSWTVTTNGVNDTANWSVSPFTHQIQRVTTWANQTFVIRGTSAPSEPITIPAVLPTGSSAPQVGLFLQYPGTANTSIPTGNLSYRSLIQSLHPKVIRLSLSGIRTYAHWDNKTRSPVFNFTAFDAALNFSRSVGASIILSLPAGTWGDGNNMPYGTPLNLALPVTFLGNTGYFPTAAAYQRFVQVVVAHTIAYNESIQYWGVGNEQPLPNASIARQYEVMFNVAEAAIHASLPNALLGSDVLTNRTYLSSFAANLKHVGFLSYHFYPAIGYCVWNGVYCPPEGGHNGTPNSGLFRPVADLTANSVFFAPHLGQEMWFNATHHWLPIFDTESNLNAVGGAHTSWVGTDPRDPTLFGAAWLIAAIIQGAEQNISALTYFTATDPATPPFPTVTAPFGGWGFGLARPSNSATGYTHFAPYWALKLWSYAVPAGSSGAVIPAPDPTVLRAYADRSSTGLTVVLSNLAAVPVQVPITLNATGFQTRAVNILDSRSYVQTFNPVTQHELLLRSGVNQTMVKAPTLTVTIQGYGVAIVQFVKTPVKGPIALPGSANGTGASPGVGAAEVPWNALLASGDDSVTGPLFGVQSLVLGRAHLA